MDTKHLSSFFGGGFWGIPKEMVRVLGIEESFWNFYLYEFRMMLITKGDLNEDESFSISQSRIQNDSGISPEKQSSFIQNAMDRGYLLVEKKGLPRRNFYKLDPEKLIDYIYSSKDKSNFPNNSQLPEKRELAPATDDKGGDVDDSQLPEKRELAPGNSAIYKEPILKNLSLIPSNEGISSGELVPDSETKVVKSSGIKITRQTPKELSDEEQLMSMKGNSIEAKKLLLFWNGLGEPIKRHKIIKSKTLSRSLDSLDHWLNMGCVPGQIMAAMRVYKKLLLMGNSKLKTQYWGVNVNLASFLSPLPDEKLNLMKIGININSWAEECLLGWDALVEKYGKEYPDKYPEITDSLIATWPGESKRFSLTEKNILRKTAGRLYNYFIAVKDFRSDATFNNKFPHTCTKFVWRVLSEVENSDFGKVPYWIQGEAFFNDTLDKFLRDINFIVPGWDRHKEAIADRSRDLAEQKVRKAEEDRSGALCSSDFL